MSGYARGGQPVSGPVARPHASQFWPVAWRHCGTESSNYWTQSCQSVLEFLQHNWNNPYNYLLLLPVGLRTWSWKANTADTMGLLWYIQRHWGQNLRVTTFRCAGRGYQRGDRVSTPKLERSSTRRYTPPPLPSIKLRYQRAVWVVPRWASRHTTCLRPYCSWQLICILSLLPTEAHRAVMVETFCKAILTVKYWNRTSISHQPRLPFGDGEEVVR